MLVSGEVGPVMARLRLASELRRLRLESGLTMDDLAAKLLVSEAKVSRMENGITLPSAADVRCIYSAIGVAGPSGGEYLDELWMQARRRSAYKHCPVFGDARVRLLEAEEAACELSQLAESTIPMLLATPRVRPYSAHGGAPLVVCLPR